MLCMYINIHTQTYIPGYFHVRPLATVSLNHVILKPVLMCYLGVSTKWWNCCCYSTSGLFKMTCDAPRKREKETKIKKNKKTKQVGIILDCFYIEMLYTNPIFLFYSLFSLKGSCWRQTENAVCGNQSVSHWYNLSTVVSVVVKLIPRHSIKKSIICTIHVDSWKKEDGFFC